MGDVFKQATIGLGVLALAASQVEAQQRNCAKRDAVIQRLNQDYSETRQAIGLGSNNTVVEVHASENGSWTITATFPNGATCIIAVGQAFEAISDLQPAKGEKV